MITALQLASHPAFGYPARLKFLDVTTSWRPTWLPLAMRLGLAFDLRKLATLSLGQHLGIARVAAALPTIPTISPTGSSCSAELGQGTVRGTPRDLAERGWMLDCLDCLLERHVCPPCARHVAEIARLRKIVGPLGGEE